MRRLQRILFQPMFVPCCVAVLMLTANFIPRVQYGITYFPTPGSGYRGFSPGTLEYGWPKTTKIDEFRQYDMKVARPFHSRYSLNHLLGLQEISVQKTHRSVALTHVVNAAFMISSVVLLALGGRAISSRRLSLISLLSVVTLTGIITASVCWMVHLQCLNLGRS